VLFAWGKRDRRDMPFFPKFWTINDMRGDRGNSPRENCDFSFNINELRTF